MLRTLNQTLPAMFGAVLITGCGGGSDSSAIPEPNETITAENAISIAKRALENDFFIDNSPFFNPSIRTTMCTHGGNVTYNNVDQDNNTKTFQPGDSKTFSFEACADEDGALNGNEKITIKEINNNNGVYTTTTIHEYDLQLKYNDTNEIITVLGSLVAKEQFSIYGNTSLEQLDQSTKTTSYVHLSTNKASITSDKNKLVIYNLEHEAKIQKDTFSYSSTWSFRKNKISSLNSSTIKVETLSNFEGSGFDRPTKGSMMVYGKNSSMKINAFPNDISTLEIDSNGDGVIDTVKQVKSDEIFDGISVYL